MHQDYLGYIWLGTAEGLYRFDGIHFTYYSGKDKGNSLGREVITSIFEDDKNILWIGAKTGLYRYKPDQKDFEKFSVGDETYPRYIHLENDSTFLIHCDKGIYMFYPHSGRWDKLDVGVNDDKAFAVMRGSTDDLWVGSENFIKKYNLRKKTSRDYMLPFPSFAQPGEKITVTNLFMDSREQLWINTWFKGIMKIDTRNGEFETMDTSNSDKKLLALFNPSIAEDAEGNIWLASENSGINIYHHASETITHIPKGIDYASGLIGSYFAVMADREKNMWVKSERALHYLAHERPIPELKSANYVNIPEAHFIHFLKPDYVLIGSYFGLYGINLETKKADNLSNTIQLPSTFNAEFQSVSDVVTYGDENLWFTSPQGLRHVQYHITSGGDPVLNYIKLYPTRHSFWPSRLAALNDSIIIVKGRSNTKVFAAFNLGTGEFDYHEFPDSLLINQLVNYKNDTIILGIRNKGLYYYNVADKSSRFIKWKFRGEGIKVQKPVFHKIVLLKNGSYALCTENLSLFFYDPKTETFEHIDIAPLANTNIVYSVEEDEDNNLWIQTSTQLLFYDRKTSNLSKINLANSFKGYTPSFFMHEGKAMYTTFEGYLYHIELNRLLSKTEKPKLYLEEMKAGNLQLDRNAKDRIRLGYSDNFLTYEFIGLDYDNPGGISYWYKMPQLSDDWIFLGNQTSVSIGRLSPGKYNFILKSANDAGVWSDEIHAPEIRITPPFWKSWWFILGMVIIAVSIAAYFLKLRRMKKESELKLRNQIARDLHDDIGSTLSGIKIFSTIASDMAGSNKDLSSLLHLIRDKSDTMMNSMSDIVWSINPAYDSLHDMIIRLKQYMSEMLESQNIEVEFKSHTDLKSHKIDLQHRKELYLALKEIINNVAKHAACHKLIFDIRKQKGEIVFFIKDDGIGMNETNIVYGNGLKNVESRIKQIEGKVIRESSPGNGTSYEIRVGLI